MSLAGCFYRFSKLFSKIVFFSIFFVMRLFIWYVIWYFHHIFYYLLDLFVCFILFGCTFTLNLISSFFRVMNSLVPSYLHFFATMFHISLHCLLFYHQLQFFCTLCIRNFHISWLLLSSLHFPVPDLFPIHSLTALIFSPSYLLSILFLFLTFPHCYITAPFSTSEVYVNTYVMHSK